MDPREFDADLPITVFPPAQLEYGQTTMVVPNSGDLVPATFAGIERRSSPATCAARVQQAAPASSDIPDVMGLLRALRRRWKLAIVGGLIFATLAGLAVYFLLPPSSYTTSALVFVAASRPKEIFETKESSVAYATYQETQVTLAKSRSVIEAALKSEEVAALPLIQRMADPADWLGDKIKVDFPRGSEILRIWMSGPYPPDAIEILVNAVTDAYMREIVDQEAQERRARLDRLGMLFDDLQKDLRKKRKDYKDVADSMGATNQQNAVIKQQILIQHLGQARQELLRLGADLRNSQARLRILESRRDEVAQDGVTTVSRDIKQIVESDPEVRELRGQLSEFDRQLQGYKRASRKSGDASIVQVNREMAAVRRSLEQRIRYLERAQSTLIADPLKPGGNPQIVESHQFIEILQEQERAVRAEVEELDKELSSLNTRSMDFHWMEDEITLAAETARTVGTEVQSMTVELKAPPRIRLLERAKAPSVADPLRRQKYTAMVSLVSLCAFLGLISLWGYRERRIATAGEVVDHVGLKLIGSLPMLPSKPSSGSSLARQELLVDSIDAIRTMLLSASRYESLQVIMVTSALKGEGKTSLSCQLATSLARSGRQTLLIDCDLRRPAAHKNFSAPLAPGVGEYLRSEIDLDQTLWQSPVPNLTLIPAGICDLTTTELLARNHLLNLFKNARERFDFIVVDSAPVLLATDSLIVSQHADAVIFSILRNISQVPPVHAAYGKLRELGVRVLGAVISGVHQSFHGYRAYAYPHENSTNQDSDRTNK